MAVQLQEVLQAKALQWNTSFSVGIVRLSRLFRFFLFSFQLVSSIRTHFRLGVQRCNVDALQFTHAAVEWMRELLNIWYNAH